MNKVKTNTATDFSARRGANFLFWSMLELGLLAILFGLMLLIFSGLTFKIVSLVAGLVLTVRGLSGLYDYLKIKQPNGLARLVLILNIITALIGAVCLFQPDFVSSIISWVLAIWILFESMSNLRRVKQVSNPDRLTRLFSYLTSGLAIGLSLLLITFPELAGISISIWLGLALILFGAQILLAYYALSRGAK